VRLVPTKFRSIAGTCGRAEEARELSLWRGKDRNKIRGPADAPDEDSTPPFQWRIDSTAPFQYVEENGEEMGIVRKQATKIDKRPNRRSSATSSRVHIAPPSSAALRVPLTTLAFVSLHSVLCAKGFAANPAYESLDQIVRIHMVAQVVLGRKIGAANVANESSRIIFILATCG